MKICTVEFIQDKKKDPFPILSKIFHNSFRKHHGSNHEIHHIRIPFTKNWRDIYPFPKKGNKGFVFNNLKLKYWVNFLKTKCTMGDNVVLSDLDMMFRSSIDSAFIDDFNIGLTQSNLQSLPINAGVVFVKVSPEAIKFFEKWNEIDNVFFFEDQDLHFKYLLRFGGMNQASLGYTLENFSNSAIIKYLPSKEWNCYGADLPKSLTENSPKIIHLKDNLRRVPRKIDLKTPDIKKQIYQEMSYYAN